MRARNLALLTSALTFTLMLVGGVVHTTGSSLACPDWPLCYGSAFPEMVGGVRFEHTHRLLGSAVGLLTLVLAMVLLRRWRGDARLMRLGTATLAVAVVQGLLMGAAVSGANKHPALLAAAFSLTLGVVALLAFASRLAKTDRLPVFGLLGFEVVILQGLLGGLTVVMRLPTAVSTTHLATAMGFLSLLVFIAFSLRGEPSPRAPLSPRAPVLVAACGVYLQCVLGALVRHTGSALACGDSVLTCGGAVWPPAGGPMQLHFAHRLLALLVTVIVVKATLAPLKAARLAKDDPRRPLVRFFGIAAHALVLVQVLLGVVTVMTHVDLALVTAHLGTGALLLLDVLALYWSLGPLGGQAPAFSSDAAPGKLAQVTG